MFFPFVSLWPVFISSTACPSLALFYVTEGWLIQVEFLRLPTGFAQWQVLWEYCGRWGLLGARETFSILYKTCLTHSMEIYNFLENEDWLIYIFRAGCIIIGTRCKTKLWRFLFKLQKTSFFLSSRILFLSCHGVYLPFNITIPLVQESKGGSIGTKEPHPMT